MIEEIFQTRLPIIGYVQLDTLSDQNFDYAYAKGILDAIHLERGMVDAIVVENYEELERGALASPESKKYMKPICLKIREIIKHAKLGINVLPADVASALELARECDFDFVHADVYADIVRSIETKKLIQVDLNYISEFRKKLAGHIPLIATIKPWHAYDVCGEEEIERAALRATEYGADAVVIVGKNGAPPEINDLKRVKLVLPQVPAGAGSGISDKTIEDYLGIADFVLISSFFKYNGIGTNPVDQMRVKQLMDIAYKFKK